MILRIIVLVLIATFAQADQTDVRLIGFFEQLKNSPDPESAHQIEQMIWALWLAHDDADINTQMKQGVGAMNHGQYDEAVTIFGRVIEQAPEFAEAWNKRATVYYLQDKLAASMRDVQRTLALEPRHFGALSGLGLIFTRIGDYSAAINAYKDVLQINPQSLNAHRQIGQLQQRLQQDMI